MEVETILPIGHGDNMCLVQSLTSLGDNMLDGSGCGDNLADGWIACGPEITYPHRSAIAALITSNHLKCTPQVLVPLLPGR